MKGKVLAKQDYKKKRKRNFQVASPGSQNFGGLLQSYLASYLAVLKLEMFGFLSFK